MVISFLIYFGFITTKSWAAVIVEAPCPEINGVENFSLSAFTQTSWYEIARYPNDWENQEECSKLSFAEDGKGYRYNLTEVLGKENTTKTLEGYIDLDVAPGSSGIINWKSKMFQASEGVVLVKDIILDVDYDSYQISYICKYDELKKVRHDYVWVLSRTKQLEGKAKTAVDNFINSSNLIVKEKLNFNDYSKSLCKNL